MCVMRSVTWVDGLVDHSGWFGQIRPAKVYLRFDVLLFWGSWILLLLEFQIHVVDSADMAGNNMHLKHVVMLLIPRWVTLSWLEAGHQECKSPAFSLLTLCCGYPLEPGDSVHHQSKRLIQDVAGSLVSKLVNVSIIRVFKGIHQLLWFKLLGCPLFFLTEWLHFLQKRLCAVSKNKNNEQQHVCSQYRIHLYNLFSLLKDRYIYQVPKP